MRPAEAIEWIIELFELTGHEVSEQVGDGPGVVDRFARPKAGRERARLYWEVWPEPAHDGAAAVDGLEVKRLRTGADRAVAVMLAGGGSEGIAQRSSSVQSLREFAFEVAGITEKLRELAASRSWYIERLAMVGGAVVQAVDYVCGWAGSPPSQRLALVGWSPSTVAREAARVQAGAWLAAPRSDITPILEVSTLPADLWGHLAPRRWLVATGEASVTRRRAQMPLDLEQRWPWEDARDAGEIVCRLDWPSPDAVVEGMRRHLPVLKMARWTEASREEPAFLELFKCPDAEDIEHLLRMDDGDESNAEWMARYVITSSRPTDLQGDVTQRDPALEAAVFEEFALGDSDKLDVLPESLRVFTKNRLLRDYYIAGHIANRFRAGDRDLLTRYRLPEKYVLLFLALISPEAAAHATADRTDELRRQIADEVEHQVQLTMSHHLKRSVGAARAHFRRIERALTEAQRRKLAREIDRLKEELDYQHRLAERTRIYHEVPETAIEDVDAVPTLRQVIDELRRRHPSVRWQTDDLPVTLSVRAQPDGLRDIVHNILENAAHAALLRDGPRVVLRARIEAETARIDVPNSGPLIVAGDRERIFDPRVTTKKGGDQPLGTGMGLPIARRYAAAVGGRVELDADAPETCFVIRLVAARERP